MKHNLFSSYGFGLIQTKAFRVLKKHTAEVLKPYSITSVDWALLGLLFENNESLRLKDVALELGVEAPFITVRAQALVTLGYITLIEGEDARAKIVNLTKKGETFVETTEPKIKAGMQHLFTHVSKPELYSYARTLEAIVKADT